MTDLSPKLHFRYAHWRKSSRSQNAGECVEVAVSSAAIGVRDSKNPHGEILVISPAQWQNLLREIKSGKLDL